MAPYTRASGPQTKPRLATAHPRRRRHYLRRMVSHDHASHREVGTRGSCRCHRWWSEGCHCRRRFGSRRRHGYPALNATAPRLRHPGSTAAPRSQVVPVDRWLRRGVQPGPGLPPPHPQPRDRTAASHAAAAASPPAATSAAPAATAAESCAATALCRTCELWQWPQRLGEAGTRTAGTACGSRPGTGQLAAPGRTRCARGWETTRGCGIAGTRCCPRTRPADPRMTPHRPAACRRRSGADLPCMVTPWTAGLPPHRR